jgi:hypothetical protein
MEKGDRPGLIGGEGMFDWRAVPGDLGIAMGLSFDDVLAMLVCAALASGWRKKAQVWTAGMAGTMAMLTACLIGGSFAYRIVWLASLISVLGGLFLAWLAYKLVKLILLEEDEEAAPQGFLLWMAFRTGVITSSDSGPAFAANAHGNTALLWTGFLTTAATIVLCLLFLGKVLDRWRWLVWPAVGWIIIAAGELTGSDMHLREWVPGWQFIGYVASIALMGWMCARDPQVKGWFVAKWHTMRDRRGRP